jgi:uncharacterized protein (DUF433 family)
LRAFIAGTQVRVQDVYGLSRQGLSPDEIAQNLPHLTLGQVHAALSYFHDHQDDILREIEEARQIVAEIRRRTGPGPMEERRNAGNGGA